MKTKVFLDYMMFAKAGTQEMVSYDLALHSAQYLMLPLLILISLILIPLDWWLMKKSFEMLAHILPFKRQKSSNKNLNKMVLYKITSPG